MLSVAKRPRELFDTEQSRSGLSDKVFRLCLSPVVLGILRSHWSLRMTPLSSIFVSVTLSDPGLR